jgi:hypothetical protein
MQPLKEQVQQRCTKSVKKMFDKAKKGQKVNVRSPFQVKTGKKGYAVAGGHKKQIFRSE